MARCRLLSACIPERTTREDDKIQRAPSWLIISMSNPVSGSYFWSFGDVGIHIVMLPKWHQ